MANELLGSGAKVYINSTAYDVKEGDCTVEKNTARGDTTGGGRYQQHVVDKQVINLNIKAIRLSSINPHLTPYFIAKSGVAGGGDDYSSVKYFPNGADVGDDTKSFRFSCVWQSYSESFQADSGLLMLTAKGVSTGPYKQPGDA